MKCFVWRLAIFLICITFITTQYGCAGLAVPGDASSSASGDSNTNTDDSWDGRSLHVATRQMPDGENNAPYWAPVAAEGGTPPYRWSLASGELPEGLALDSTQGIVSGTTQQPGQFPFTLRVEDAETSARADLRINVASEATGLSQGCTGSGCYGPAIGADGLANTTVGPAGNMVSYRFRAQKTGVVEKLLVYLIPDRTGYSGGTSGQLQITVYADDDTSAHNPSAARITSYLLKSPLAAKPSRYFPLVTFASPPALVAGRLYHIVFSNADPHPSVNYLSVDALYLQTPATPAQPAVSDVDSAVLLGRNGSWSQRKGYTPIMQLQYADGSSTGIGYMEGWVGAQQRVSGTHAAREAFTVSGPARRVKLVGVRAARVSGNDNLRVRLENEDGSVLDEGVIAAAAYPLSRSPAHRWATFVFSTTHVLTPGKTYHLVLQAPSTSVYQVFPIRKGMDYGFADSTFFRDGSAEFTSGSRWVGWTQWGVSNRTDSDLQFYFGLVR